MKCQEVAVKSEQSGEIMETKLKTIAQDIHKTLSELLQVSLKKNIRTNTVQEKKRLRTCKLV